MTTTPSHPQGDAREAIEEILGQHAPPSIRERMVDRLAELLASHARELAALREERDRMFDEREAWRDRVDQVAAQGEAQMRVLRGQLDAIMDPLVRAKMLEPAPPLVLNADESGKLLASQLEARTTERDRLRLAVDGAREALTALSKWPHGTPVMVMTARDALAALEKATVTS